MSVSKIYDFEERTFEFARTVKGLVKNLPRTIGNVEDGKQVVRSSGSVAVNYIEANDSSGEKDKLMKIRICKKESKESRLWLKLLDAESNDTLEIKRKELIIEAHELMLIFGSILQKLKQTK